MTMKEAAGFLLLAAGIVGAGGGIALVSRGLPMGYVGLLIAPFLLFFAYRNVRESAA